MLGTAEAALAAIGRPAIVVGHSLGACVAGVIGQNTPNVRAVFLEDPPWFLGDPDEWKKMCAENAMIRILEGGKKIVGKPENFYDGEVISGLTADWQRGNRAMHHILSKMKLKTGDVFLLWRMQQLSADGKLQINGDPSKGWKEFEVKLKAEELVVGS